MERSIIITSCFGHEIMAMLFAQVYGEEIVVCPQEENEAEYAAKAERIAQYLGYFGDLKIAPFGSRHEVANQARDIIAELKSGRLPDTVWMDFFSSKLEPALNFNEPSFCSVEGSYPSPIFWVPQKLLTDGECGVTAREQSLTPDVFDFLRERKLVLGQHFDKEKDIEAVKALNKEFAHLYVPGMTENPELLGLRGVEHRLYHNLYTNVKGCVGIAGTHTWILLTMFPQKPQVILYNKNGIEHWQAIARAARRRGRKVVALGFDQSTDMDQLSKQIEKACRGLDII